VKFDRVRWGRTWGGVGRPLGPQGAPGTYLLGRSVGRSVVAAAAAAAAAAAVAATAAVVVVITHAGKFEPKSVAGRPQRGGELPHASCHGIWTRECKNRVGARPAVAVIDSLAAECHQQFFLRSRTPSSLPVAARALFVHHLVQSGAVPAHHIIAALSVGRKDGACSGGGVRWPTRPPVQTARLWSPSHPGRPVARPPRQRARARGRRTASMED